MAAKFFKKFFLIFFVVILLVGLNLFVFPGFFRDIVFKITRVPGAVFEEKIGNVVSYGKYFSRLSGLINENKRLIAENTDLRGKTAALTRLENENAVLRNQLGISKKTPRQLLETKIFGLKRDLLSSSILVNKGKADGVAKSMPVIAAGNILAGRISEVYSDTALVLALDDPRSTVSIRIGDGAVIGNAKGLGENSVLIDLVTNKDIVNEGDLVTTSGLDGLPEALIVGKIKKVELKSGSLFKSVEAELEFNPVISPMLFIITRQ